MKIVYNKLIPFRGYKAMAVWPFVFVRSECKGRFTATDANHETIHLQQQKEMLLILFLLWYGLEWVFRLVQYKDAKRAYRNISFEREAYGNEYDFGYLRRRKCFAWMAYLNGNK